MTEVIPVAEPIAEQVTATPVDIPAVPPVDIEKALETSGLVMVETSSEKASAWQPEAPVVSKAPRRRRPVQVAATDEPLIMVETVNKD